MFGTGARSSAASGVMERNVVVLSVARRVSLFTMFRSSNRKVMSTTGGCPGKKFEPDRMPPLRVKLLVGLEGWFWIVMAVRLRVVPWIASVNVSERMPVSMSRENDLS